LTGETKPSGSKEFEMNKPKVDAESAWMFSTFILHAILNTKPSTIYKNILYDYKRALGEHQLIRAHTHKMILVLYMTSMTTTMVKMRRLGTFGHIQNIKLDQGHNMMIAWGHNCNFTEVLHLRAVILP
ncbi:hypothetical protein ACJX0J_037804, partial [Zea mays]